MDLTERIAILYYVKGRSATEIHQETGYSLAYIQNNLTWALYNKQLKAKIKELLRKTLKKP